MATQQHVNELVNKLIKVTNSSSFEEALAILLTSAQTGNRARSLIQKGFLQIAEKIRHDQELTVEEVAIVDQNVSFFIDVVDSGKLTEDIIYEDDTRGEVPKVLHELSTELDSEIHTSKQKDSAFVSSLVDNYIDQSRANIRTAELEKQKRLAVNTLSAHTYDGDIVGYLDKTFNYQAVQPEARRQANIISSQNEVNAKEYIERHNRIVALKIAKQSVLEKASEDFPSGDRGKFVNFRHYAQAVKTIGQIPEYQQNKTELEAFATYTADAIAVYEDPVRYENAPPKLLDSVLRLKGISDEQLKKSPLSLLSEEQQKQGLHFILQADTYTLFTSKETAPITKVGKVLVGNTFFEVARESLKDVGPDIKDSVPKFITPFIDEIMMAAGDPEKNVAVQFVLATSSGEQKEGSFLELIHLTPGHGNDLLHRQEGSAHLLTNLFPKTSELLTTHEHTRFVGMKVVSLGERFYTSLPQPFIAFLVKRSSLLRAINFQFTGRLIPLLTGGRVAVTAGSVAASKVASTVVLTGLAKIGLLAAKITTGPVGWAILGLQIGFGFLKNLLGKNNGEKKGMSPVAIGCLVILIPFILMGLFLILQQNTNTQIAINVGRGLGAGGGIDCSKNPGLPGCALSECVGSCEWPVQTACIYQGPLGQTSHARSSLSAIDFIGNGGTLFGAAVYSPYAGTVTASVFGYEDNSGKVGSQDGGTYGNHVTINSPDGPTMLYAHMRNIKVVSVGDSISAKQLIGYVDHTGYSEGPHLHYERLDGNINEYTPYPVPQCDNTADCTTKLNALGNPVCF